MTPKEQAKELVHRYVDLTDGWVYGIKSWEHKKKCALIAVDAVMDELTVMNYGLQYLNRMAYWNEVKEEIEKL